MSTRTADRNITLVFAKNIYKSNENPDYKSIEKKIKTGKKQYRTHLICESDKDGEMFVIYKANELLLPVYDNSIIRVVGIGKGRRDTLKLLSNMLSDMQIYDKEAYGNFTFDF